MNGCNQPLQRFDSGVQPHAQRERTVSTLLERDAVAHFDHGAVHVGSPNQRPERVWVIWPRRREWRGTFLRKFCVPV